MNIGIIGTGAIGGTIAKKMVAAGHDVKVYNWGGEEKLKARAAELGVVASTSEAVVEHVDVVILSLPTAAISGLAEGLFTNLPDSVIVVDTSNYYPFRDAEIDELQNGKVESVWVSDQIGRPVIKAFNNLLAETLANGGKAEGEENRIAMAIAGDSVEAKKVISGLINDAGYDVVDAGNLSDSWRHQPGTPAYCTELNAKELQQALSDTNKENAAALRDNAILELSGRTPFPTHQEIVEFNRSMFLNNPKKTL